MIKCWSCSSDLGVLRKPGREEICPSCNAWVHCCKNCAFWDDSARTCEEPAAEWVHDRERANFCDFFALAVPDAPGATNDDRRPPPPASGRDAFERLFRKS